jgi:SPX domain protein involved in polyphosphate accumulation
MGLQHRYQRCRYEYKYLIDEARARNVRDFIRSYLCRDEHGLASMHQAYPIYSLYLDGPGLMLYNATVQAQMNRFKLRVRYYNHEPGSPLFCEIKRRVNEVIFKDRADIRRDALSHLLGGRCPCTEDLADPGDVDSLAALNKFFELRNSVHAQPRIIVYFEREAWISPSDDNTRITFDRKAAAAHYVTDLNPEIWTGAEVGSVILELKFDDRFPTWMRELVRSCDLYRTNMGKYVHCMNSLPQAATPFMHARVS